MKKYILIFFTLFTVSTYAQKSDFNTTNFNKADSIAMQYKNASLKNLPLLANKLTYRLTTDAEKFRAIYFWICHNIKSDYSATNKILQKGKKYRNDRERFIAWNNEHKQKVFEKLFAKKETICTGYALLLRELCKLSGIEAKVVNGYYKGSNFNAKKPYPNHSWNAVLLNNKWYLCDTTLAAGYFFVDIDTFIFDYNDGYFLTEPILFASNHFPEDTKWLLLEKDEITFNNFIDRPYVYGKTFEHSVAPMLPNTLAHKTSIDKKVNFELEIEKEKIENLTIITNSGWKETSFSPTDYSYSNGVLSFSHLFSKKGLYDVHFKITNDIVTTYTIEVI